MMKTTRFPAKNERARRIELSASLGQRRQRWWLVLSLFLCSASSCSIGTRQPPVIENARAVLRVITEKRSFALGEKIYVTIELRNITSKSLWVRRSMWLSSKRDPVDRSVWLEVVSPRGNEIRFGCGFQSHSRGHREYKVLGPGEALQFRDDLAWCYEMNEVGSYLVRAYYKDEGKLLPFVPMGTSHLRELITSELITIEISG
jgi:hypothetical protein